VRKLYMLQFSEQNQPYCLVAILSAKCRKKAGNAKIYVGLYIAMAKY
jgi:hypothetical protein